MTFSIIGTGNVGWFFGKRLAAAGHQCKGVYGRKLTAVKELADTLLSNKYGNINEARDEDADVCFLAVSDSAVQEVAAQLTFKQTVLIHMAGALPLDTIKSAATDRAVLWPVYSIICAENKLPATVLQPLITQTFDRVKYASPLTTQTGPAIRDDTTTIHSHLELLAMHPHLHKLYEALTESIQEMHKPKGE